MDPAKPSLSGLPMIPDNPSKHDDIQGPGRGRLEVWFWGINHENLIKPHVLQLSLETSQILASRPCVFTQLLCRYP